MFQRNFKMYQERDSYEYSKQISTNNKQIRCIKPLKPRFGEHNQSDRLQASNNNSLRGTTLSFNQQLQSLGPPTVQISIEIQMASPGRLEKKRKTTFLRENEILTLVKLLQNVTYYSQRHAADCKKFSINLHMYMKSFSKNSRKSFLSFSTLYG